MSMNGFSMNLKQIFALTLLLATSERASAAATGCGTAKGVDLTRPGGPYAEVYVRDQGRNGNCFAFSATSLLQSHLGCDALDPFGAAASAGLSVEGGHPAEPIKAMSARGWACISNGALNNLFPSQEDNFIVDLRKAFLGDPSSLNIVMPVFYTANSNTPEGRARQARIADKAAKLATGEAKPCSYYGVYDSNLQTSKDLLAQIAALQKQKEELESHSSSTSIGNWWEKNYGTKMNNAEIQAKVTAIQNRLNPLEAKQKASDAAKMNALYNLVQGKKSLDKYTEDQAAEIVYYWAKDAHKKVVDVYSSYGFGDKAPTMAEMIKGWVQWTPKEGYANAIAGYPEFLLSRLAEQNCPPHHRVVVPKNIVVKTTKVSAENSDDVSRKIQGLFQQAKPQGLGIVIDPSLLQNSSFGDSTHAVNLVGCRTVNGALQYLVQNSWGEDCGVYREAIRGDCTNGRVWINATDIMKKSHEIEWIERTK